MKLATFTCAALLLTGAAAAASSDSLSGVIERLHAEGWRDIDVDHADGRVEIAAARDGAAREWVYDAWSGWLISVRTERVADRWQGTRYVERDGRPGWWREQDDDGRSDRRDRDDDDDDGDDDDDRHDD